MPDSPDTCKFKFTFRRSAFQPRRPILLSWCWRVSESVGPSMLDIITNDIEDRQAADAETELRGWEIQGDRLRAPTNPIPVAIYPQRRTATASWQRSILIITALSTLTWAAVVLVVIEALAHL